MDDADLVATKPGAAPAGDSSFSPHERYVLIEKLGEGGMGAVFAAHDKVLDRTIALKVLHGRYLGAADQERLAAEARVMARLSHRNVIQVYDVAENGGRTYLTMELVRGQHLGRWLEQPRSWTEIVAVFRAVASGLAAAHTAGIVHRDVKPSNILVGDDGEVRVADFGVAHASIAAPDPDATPTAETAGMIGTIAYMSPAQLRGQPADARCDQFAFFSSLFEALHGQRPFAAATVADQIVAVEAGCPRPINDVPRWLQAAIERGLSRDPASRFPTMVDVRQALGGPPRRRGWLVLGGAVVLAASAGAWMVLGTDSGRSCPDPARELIGVWDADAAQRGRGAFSALPAVYAQATWERIAKELELRAAEWAASADAACRDFQPKRRACVAEQRALLGAIATRLAAPDPRMPSRAMGLFVELPPGSDCASSAYLAAVSDRSEPGVISAHADLARARADLALGPTPEGRDAAESARNAARAHADPALEVAATLVHARAAHALGDPAGAATELATAVVLAGQLHAPAVELDALLALASAELARGQPAAARAAATRALTVASSLEDPRRHALALAIAAETAEHDGDDEAARAQLVTAVQIATSAHLDGTLWIAPIIGSLARAQLRTRHFEEAIASSKLEVELMRRLGERHPAYGRAVARNGMINLNLARLEKARGKANTAMRVARDAFGEDHLDVADVHDLLAAIAIVESNDLRAATELRAALSIRERLAPDASATRMTRRELDKVVARLPAP